MKSPRPSGALSWLGGLLAVYLVVPMAAFAWRLVTSNQRGFTSPSLWPALRTSVEAATVATAIIAVAGIPLAFVLARSRGRLARVVGAAVVLPLALPPVMAGILLVYLFGPYTTIGRLFDGRLVSSLAGIIAAQVFVSAPFLVVAARSAFAAADTSVEDLAATLGHGPIARFWKVSLPVAGPAIRAGLLLAWLRAIGEYGANVVVAYHPFTIPVYTYVQFSGAGIPDTQAPTVLVLVAAGVATALFSARRPAFLRRRVEDPEPVAPGRSTPAAVDLDLDVEVGSFALRVAYKSASHRLAILGPSGSGKSLTLKSIAGLLGAGSARVRFSGLDVTDQPAERRGVGYVPQGHGLVPTLTVRDQARFGVAARADVAAWWVQRLGLAGLEDRYPHQLSGGQRQRVSFAAALSSGPRVVLLDEPFSALDTPVRNQLRRELRKLQRENDLSTVLVTHDPAEAAILADEVIVLEAGRVLQAGAVGEVFRYPASAEVARLVGVENVLEGVASPPGTLVAGNAAFPADVSGFAPGDRVSWAVRPEDVEVYPVGTVSASPASGRTQTGVIVDVTDFAVNRQVLIRLEGGVEILSRVSPASTRGDPDRTISFESPYRMVDGGRCEVRIALGKIRVWPFTPEDPPSE